MSQTFIERTLFLVFITEEREKLMPCERVRMKIRVLLRFEKGRIALGTTNTCISARLLNPAPPPIETSLKNPLSAP